MLVHGARRTSLGRIDPATRCDLGLVDDLLRLQLLAKRFGWALVITEVRPDLRELFEMVGLADHVDG